MGLAQSVSDSAGGGASDVVSSAASKAGGNPLAAGLIAFGTGLVISSLIPASDKEAELAGQVVEAAKEHGQPLIDQAKSVGQEGRGSGPEAVGHRSCN